MHLPVSVYLYGSLPNIVGQESGKFFELSLNGPTPLVDALSMGQIPVEAVQLAMLNHKPVQLNATIRPGDRLALFPKEYPFFVDWYDFRNKPKSIEKNAPKE